MNNYLNLIKSTSKNYADHLLRISENKELQFQSFTIKADQICKRDWQTIDIRKSDEYKDLFNELMKLKKSPILYIAEVQNNSINFRETIDEFLNSNTGRAFPAFTENRINNIDSNVLYVGKVKKDFHGRIIQHMGYNKNPQTQGLQLCKWIPKINLDVTFKYLVLHPEIGNFLSSIEYAVASELKPLLGKHK
jgi:hypothetical protein